MSEEQIMSEIEQEYDDSETTEVSVYFIISSQLYHQQPVTTGQVLVAYIIVSHRDQWIYMNRNPRTLIMIEASN